MKSKFPKKQNIIDYGLDVYNKSPAKLQRTLFIFYNSFLRFNINQVPVRAAALTFTSLLAIVPFGVILSVVAGKIGYLKLLTRVLPELNASLGVNLPLDQVEEIIFHIQGINFGSLGLVGIISLLLSFLLAMSNLEKAVNIIWEVNKNRNWLLRLRDYLPFLLLLILFILLISWMLVKLHVYLDQLLHGVSWLQINPTIQFTGILLGVLGFVWAFTAILYFHIPHTRVRWISALAGSTISTLLLSGFLFLAVNLQAAMFSRYSVLYGSIAIFPLIMLVFYLAWVIILYGVTFSCEHQKERL